LNNTLFNLLVFIGLGTTILTIVLLMMLLIALFIKFIRKKSKKIPKKPLVSICILGIVSVAFWASWIGNPSFLPQGYSGQILLSPKGDFQAQIYHMNGFIDYKNVRVDVVNNQSKKKEMIYYDFVNKPLEIIWIEDDTLKIENRILKVDKDKFDYRTQK